MARRRNYKKKGNNNARIAGTRAQMYYGAGAQLWKDVKYLKSVINVERKFIDVSAQIQTVPTSTTGVVVPINLTATGTTQNTRIGLSIKMMSIMVEGIAQLSVGATQDFIHVSVVLDRQVSGVLPSWANIYTTNGGTSYASLAQRSQLSVDRFKVLKDFTISLDAQGNQLKKFKCFINLPDGTDAHAKYNANSALISDIYTNAIYLVYSGREPITLSTISYYTRIRFVDN